MVTEKTHQAETRLPQRIQKKLDRIAWQDNRIVSAYDADQPLAVNLLGKAESWLGASLREEQQQPNPSSGQAGARLNLAPASEQRRSDLAWAFSGDEAVGAIHEQRRSDMTFEDEVLWEYEGDIPEQRCQCHTLGYLIGMNTYKRLGSCEEPPDILYAVDDVPASDDFRAAFMFGFSQGFRDQREKDLGQACTDPVPGIVLSDGTRLQAP